MPDSTNYGRNSTTPWQHWHPSTPPRVWIPQNTAQDVLQHSSKTPSNWKKTCPVNRETVATKWTLSKEWSMAFSFACFSNVRMECAQINLNWSCAPVPSTPHTLVCAKLAKLPRLPSDAAPPTERQWKGVTRLHLHPTASLVVLLPVGVCLFPLPVTSFSLEHRESRVCWKFATECSTHSMLSIKLQNI